jgi:hypothetical protein
MRSLPNPDITDEILQHTTDNFVRALSAHCCPTFNAMLDTSDDNIHPASSPSVNTGACSSKARIPFRTKWWESSVRCPRLYLRKPPLCISGSSISDVDPKQEQQEITLNAINSAPVTQVSANGNGERISEALVDVVNVDTEDKASPPPAPTAPSQLTQRQCLANEASYPDGLAIDVCFEASKLPLDVAIFNSARAAGGDEKIRKYLQAVLVIGGTALLPGMAHALESRSVRSLIVIILSILITSPIRKIAGHCDTLGSQHGKGANHPASQGR